MMKNAEAPAKVSRLSRVVRGKIERPVRVALFGTDGLGKSTWASNAPSPIFLGAEDGTAQLDVSRMPDIATWEDLLECIDELHTGGEHTYKTVVIDTLDWAEPMCWAYVCKQAKKESIEDLPYGKGYTAALDQWRLLLSKLERLRDARGMHIVLLAHSVLRTFKNPEGEDFERYEMKLHAKASGLIREWVDCVLFGRFETFADKDEKTKRVRGISSGARVIQTQRTAAYDAKNRYDLPEALPLDWQAFADAVAAHQPADPAKLKERIAALLEQVDETIKGKARGALEKAGDDAAQLARIADRLAAEAGIKGKVA